MRKILVVFCAILLACVISCGKATQPKKFEQYDVLSGAMVKGGIDGGYILKSDDTSFVAMRNTRKIYTDRAVFKVKMKAHQQADPRNGFIRLITDKGQTIEAGILIGSDKYHLGGSAVAKQEIAVKFDKNKLFTIELIIDIKKKEATAIIDGKILKSEITQQFKEIKWIGYVGYNTQTEFTEIEEM